MNNIPIRVMVEGKKQSTQSDWSALKAMLAQKHVDCQHLQTIYDELNAGLIVSTRGLTIEKVLRSQPQYQDIPAVATLFS